MGRKGERERQKRLQRKREKREARRSARGSAGAASGSLAAQYAAATCIAACELLLSACERLDGSVRREVAEAARVAGGVWTRLPFELEHFLLDEAPWTVTCRELEPARDPFLEYGAEQVFSRLWCLSLTNEPEESALFDLKEADCPYRAALAFEGLRLCLADAAFDPSRVLPLIEREIEMHSRGNREPKREYRRLLADAVASVRLPAPKRSRAVEALATRCSALLGRWAAEHSGDAWWHCGRLFLAEIFERHAASGCGVDLTHHPGLMPSLVGEAHAVLARAQQRGPEPLRAIHFQSNAQEWRRLLDECVELGALGFEDRVRYEIARLKLLRTFTVSSPEGSSAARQREWLAAFDGLLALLSHGVPPASRAVPALIEPPLAGFYVEAVSRMHCEDLALDGTEALLHRHPHDFRLACLLATGAAARGSHHRLAELKEHAPWRHIEPALFARCAVSGIRAPKGRKAAAAIRALLFDPLDREQRKQCLLELGAQALRRASTLPAYAEELQALAPYLDRDSFVYRDLRENAALESGLVFLATMMAERNGLELSLTEAQSQQWVSHAREIARQSPFGSRLVLHHLRAPSRGFSLTPEVREAARARSSDFEPYRPPVPSAPRAETAVPTACASAPSSASGLPHQAKRASRKHRFAAPAEQRGLFDALDP